jgi:hypothetical protein
MNDTEYIDLLTVDKNPRSPESAVSADKNAPAAHDQPARLTPCRRTRHSRAIPDGPAAYAGAASAKAL